MKMFHLDMKYDFEKPCQDNLSLAKPSHKQHEELITI